MEHMTFSEYILNSNIINSIFVLVILVWLMKKFTVFSFINYKQVEITNTIKKAEMEKIEHDLNLAKTREMNKNVDTETGKILSESQDIGNSLYAKIISDTQNEIILLNRRNEKTIAAEKESLKNEVSKKVTGAAFQIAQEHIKQAIDEEMHQNLINDFIDDLDIKRLNNNE